jgi:hypothetical protein
MRFLPRAPMILMALAPLALAGALTGPVAAATAAPSVTAAACSAWNGALPVNTDTVTLINGVAPVSACDVWAVGSAGTQPLIEHWTGGSWVTVDPHLPGSSAPYEVSLDEVSAVSASDIWAAGTITPTPDSPKGILFLHYNGSTWTQVDSNVSVPGDPMLFSLDARAANDAWLAGTTTAGHSLIMHWDGSHWRPSAVPPDFAADTGVSGISADSATDAWAGGSGPGSGTFMLRWDGSRWNPADFPVPDNTGITGVAALSPGNAWAVGWTTGLVSHPVIMHWDGAHWAPMTSPNPGGEVGTRLLKVIATSASSVFVLATYQKPEIGKWITIVMHWDGSSWAASALPLPSQGAGAAINTMGVSGAGQAWIGGWAQNPPFVSIAAPVPVVPDVSGGQVGAANATLGTYGLTGSTVLNHTTDCPASSSGLVVGQDPAAGQIEPFGLAVSLTVCTTPATVAVPSVLSQGDQDAQNAITAAGLTVGPVTMRANCTASRGVVLIQNPDPGVQVSPGTPVSLVESTGRQPNGHLCVVN